jgi:hypothetical protein
MEAYKIHSDISEKGEIIIQNLPFKDKKNVEIIILVDVIERSGISKETELNKLTSSFGTINSSVVIQDNSLSRENLYNDMGR